MPTLSETIATGRARVESLRFRRFARTQLLDTFDELERVITLSRTKVLEAITVLGDNMATREQSVEALRAAYDALDGGAS